MDTTATAKMQLVLPQYQVTELNAIERETDRPRARLIRRAVEQFLLRYREDHPEFARKHPRAIEETIEKELKPGLVADVVIFKGIKREVIVTETGWRYATEDDYVDLNARTIPTSMSVIDVPVGEQKLF
jgi:hypothetical protein